MTEHEIEYIVYGPREAMIAEYAAFDPCTIGIPAKECRYLVKPVGVHDYDTEWFPWIKAAGQHARYLGREMAVKVFTVA